MRKLLIAFLLLTACSRPSPKRYVSTGFYFLSEDTEGGNMRLKESGKLYTINPIPFASVKNVLSTKLEKTNLESGVYAELCLIFDSEGTEDITEGTGDPSKPAIAVVVANQLLYVLDKSDKITTGVMCIGLPGYSDTEINALKNAVDHKR